MAYSSIERILTGSDNTYYFFKLGVTEKDDEIAKRKEWWSKNKQKTIQDIIVDQVDSALNLISVAAPEGSNAVKPSLKTIEHFLGYDLSIGFDLLKFPPFSGQ